MLIRNAVWSFGAQLVRLLTALLLVALLDPAARGLQSLLVLLPTVIASLTLLGVGNATPVLLNRGVSQQRLLANLIALALVVIGLVMLVLLPLLPFLAAFLSDPQYYIATPGEVFLGLLLLPPTLLGDYLRSLLAARRDLRQVALSQSVQAIAQLVLAILFVPLLRWGPIGAVWAAVAAGWLGLLYVLGVMRPLGSLRPRLEGEVLRPLLGLGLRGHVGNIVQTFNYRLDTFLVQAFLGLAAVGLYQTGVLLAEMIWYLPNAIGAALLPQIAATGDRELTPRVARHTLCLTGIAALVLAACAWPAFALLRPAYLPAVVPMVILSIGVVALSLHKILASDLSGRGFPQYPSCTSALALVITIVANVVLIPRLGIAGAALASSIAYTVQTAALLVIYRRVASVNWHELLLLQRADILVYRRLLTRWREVPQ